LRYFTIRTGTSNIKRVIYERNRKREKHIKYGRWKKKNRDQFYRQRLSEWHWRSRWRQRFNCNSWTNVNKSNDNYVASLSPLLSKGLLLLLAFSLRHAWNLDTRSPEQCIMPLMTDREYVPYARFTLSPNLISVHSATLCSPCSRYGLYFIACFVLCPRLPFANERTTFPVTRVANSFTGGSSHRWQQLSMSSRDPQALSHLARINTHNDRLRETSRQRSVKKERSSLPYIRQYNGEHNPKGTDRYSIAIFNLFFIFPFLILVMKWKKNSF